MTVRLELPVNPDGGKEPSGGGGPGPAGPGLPVGGVAGDAPVKTSGTNYATAWVDVATQDELDTVGQGLTLTIGEVANEVADLVAALGDPDQIAWGAAWDAAGEVTGYPAADVFGLMIGAASSVGALQASIDALADQVLHQSFEIEASTATPVDGGTGGFADVDVQVGAFDGAVRTSTGTVDDNVVLAIPSRFRSEPGTWTITLSHYAGPDCGIYSIESLEEDQVTWDVVGTVDGYAAVPAAAQTVLSGITIAAGNDTLRITMATKNPLSSSFVGRISALSGVFIYT